MNNKDNEKSGTILNDKYPPQAHMLRDLQITLEHKSEGRATIHAPVVREVCTSQGAMHAGIISILVDALGGSVSLRAAYPDWTVTKKLSICISKPARDGMVVAKSSTLHVKQSEILSEIDIFQETNNPLQPMTSIGSAIVTSLILPRKEYNLDFKINENETETWHFATETSGLTKPYRDKVGLRIINEATGVVEIGLSDYFLNSFGAIQGGMVAFLADISGQCAAQAASGKSLTTCDLEIYYLAQGKVGPFRTRAKVLRSTNDTVLTRVEIVDVGAEYRLLTVAMNTAIFDETLHS
ncbi:hotdog domain-containing protein [Thermodesulfobacteriota bacterium]